MHTGRVTEYVKVLANMFLETLCMYVYIYVHIHKTHACTHTHILWFGFLLMLQNCGMDHCQYLCIGLNFFFIPAPLHMVLDVWYNNNVADFV